MLPTRPLPARARLRPRPRRRALWLLAAAAPLLLAASLLQPRAQDQGLLFDLAGRPVDALGMLRAGWQRLQRDCSAVQRPAAGSPAWQQAQHALAAHSPPASHGARLLQLLLAAPGDWLLAEVVWDRPGSAPGSAPLDPAIVPLRRVGTQWQVLGEGVWSGDTGPWHAPVFIRRWLRQQVPGLPPALSLCLDPRWPAFAG
ncbi:MAG: hypothetical protein KA774_10525 [Burkholderiaceae bacterium]|jgi:hypothetical protein|nr:hypothetical protein [Burkholderiaceae bacterium]